MRHPVVANACWTTRWRIIKGGRRKTRRSGCARCKCGLILQDQKHYAEAEPYFRKIIDKDRTFNPAYMDLYRLYMSRAEDGERRSAAPRRRCRIIPKSHDYLERLAYHYGALGRRERHAQYPAARSRKRMPKILNPRLNSQVVGDFYLPHRRYRFGRCANMPGERYSGSQAQSHVPARHYLGIDAPGETGRSRRGKQRSAEGESQGS